MIKILDFTAKKSNETIKAEVFFNTETGNAIFKSSDSELHSEEKTSEKSIIIATAYYQSALENAILRDYKLTLKFHE